MNQKKAVAIVVAVVTLVVVVWGFKNILPAFFPEWFVSSGGGGGGVSSGGGTTTPPSNTSTTTAPPPADSAGADMIERALDELTPEAIAKDPGAAVTRLSQLMANYGATAPGQNEKAQARVNDIRQQYAKQLEPKENEARAEVDKFIAAAKPRLERLEHTSVVVELRQLENRFAGYAATGVAKTERERIKAEWEKLSPREKQARTEFARLAPKFSDDASRIDGVKSAGDIAVAFSDTRCGRQAEVRCDEILVELKASLDKQAKADPAAARALCEKTLKELPEPLRDSPAAKRIAELGASIK